MKPKTDLTGERFGRLIVEEISETHITPSGQKKTMWKCLCDCGNSKIVRYEQLKYGKTVSCGCYRDENTGNRSRKTGLSGTVEYTAYKDMVGRCTNKNSKLWEYYGGRGISVCDRWLEKDCLGLHNFIQDMGLRPEGMSLDRIDPNGDYEAANCRWADSLTQSFNKRKHKNNTSGRTGVRLRGKKWYASISVKGVIIGLGIFTTYEEACNARSEAEMTYYGKIKQ